MMAFIILIFNVLIALPKIFSFIKEMVTNIEAINKRKEEGRRQQAIDELNKAKTKKEVKDAAEKYLDT